jgi:hypothetical protein
MARRQKRRGGNRRRLSQPLYAGRIKGDDGGERAGQHEAIIDAETWVAVEGMRAEAAEGRAPTARRALDDAEFSVRLPSDTRSERVPCKLFSFALPRLSRPGQLRTRRVSCWIV